MDVCAYEPDRLLAEQQQAAPGVETLTSERVTEQLSWIARCQMIPPASNDV
jgi:hypothetical protein